MQQSDEVARFLNPAGIAHSVQLMLLGHNFECIFSLKNRFEETPSGT